MKILVFGFEGPISFNKENIDIAPPPLSVTEMKSLDIELVARTNGLNDLEQNRTEAVT